MTWQDVLHKSYTAPSFGALLAFIEARAQVHPVYPPRATWFRALNETPYDAVKMVILGQDPYHGLNQATGLAFSVNRGVALPPSLINIFKELQGDLGVLIPKHGDLSSWAAQGVLLLNTTLTVEAGRPLSHAKLGWSAFTDDVIDALNHKKTPVVFLLWGKHAQSKERLINQPLHRVLKAPHPSPLSAHRGFFGCRHFSQANAHLMAHGLPPIDFSLEG